MFISVWYFTEVRRNGIDVPEESLAMSTDMHVNFDEDDYKDVAGNI